MLDWLKKKTNKYTSPEIQNEILKLMALQVLREVAANLHSTTFYTIMVDETTDVSNDEQVVLCLRWVDDLMPTKNSLVCTKLIASVQILW